MPTRRRPTAPIAAALAVAALACAAAPAGAADDVRTDALWIDAVLPDGSAGRAVPALLHAPHSWMVGDAAAVVLSDGPWPGPGRERLVAALLGEGAAVLALDVTTARGFSPENAKMGPPATAEELVPDVRGAADALRREVGAGLVVALGHGAGGGAAVLAAELERAAGRRHGADPAIAAAASLGPGPARFVLGGAEPGRGWPARAGLLCGVLAVEAVPFEPGAEPECRRALLGPGESYAVQARKP